MSAWDTEGKVAIGFRRDNRMVRMMVPMPRKDDKRFTNKTYAGRPAHAQRPKAKAQELWEQACRERWRAVLLIVKAKMEAIDVGVSMFEREFLADILLPNGGTVEELMTAQIETAYTSGSMPRGLLMLTAGKDGE